MHIGLIGGIGPGATDYYYKGLIRALAQRGKDLDLTIAHADAPTLIGNLGQGDNAGQAAIFRKLVGRLQAAGAETAAITSVAGHFCVDELIKVSPLPMIEIFGAVEAAMTARGLTKVGLIGTRQVMESSVYGKLPTVEFVTPAGVDLDGGAGDRSSARGLFHRRQSALRKPRRRGDHARRDRLVPRL